MINMGELFAHGRMTNIPMDRVPLTEKEKANSMIKKGDLLFARQSLVRSGAGQCSIFLDDSEEVCFESHLIRCRLNKEIANPLFFYYFFLSYAGKTAVDAIIEQGAGASGIRGSDLSKLPVPDIDKTVQDNLAKILDAIDQKIEINTQANQTLEQIAQVIFKSWFVDFDPVKAKIAALEAGGTQDAAELAAMCVISGKDEAQLAQLKIQDADAYQQLAQTAALFPAAMQEGELGEIPEGWGVCKFQEFAYVIMGQSPAGDTYNTEANGMPLINGPVEFDIYYPKKSKWTTSPTKLAAKGDLVVCVRGSTTGRFVKSDDVYCLGRGVCAVRGKQYQSFVDLIFKYNIEQLLQLATGSTFPNWSAPTLNSFLVISPDAQILNIFEGYVKALVSKLENNVENSSFLSQLRDSLLPKLLSGEIDLCDIQSEVA